MQLERKFDHDQAIADYKAGICVKEIAHRHGVSSITVYKVLNRAGVMKPYSGGAGEASAGRWRLVVAMLRDGHPVKVVAHETGIHERSVTLAKTVLRAAEALQ